MRSGSVFKQSALSMLLIAALAPLSVSYAEKKLDDPMQPPGEQVLREADKGKVAKGVKKAVSRYQLSAIRIDHNRPNSAIINGKLVSVGSRIDQGEVVAIMPNSVKLKYLGRTLTIPLLPTRIKKTVEASQP
jgi:hypothetical protein